MARSFNLIGSSSCSSSIGSSISISSGNSRRGHAKASPLLVHLSYTSSPEWAHLVEEGGTFSAQRTTCLAYRGRKSLLFPPSKRLSFGGPRQAFRGGGGSSGGGKDESVGRTAFNLAAAGILTYLTVSGSFNWFFEGISFLLIFFWITRSFLQRQLIKGTCPNCGNGFDTLEFSMQEVPQLCPFCSQPFRLENKQFVREEPRFSTQQKRDFRRPFKGFQQSSSAKKQEEGTIVDIEAEVLDKD